MGLLKQPDNQKLASGTIEKHCERWCTSSRSAVTRRVSRLDSNRSVRRVTANYGQPKAVGARESNDASVQHAAFDSTRGVCRMVLVFYVMLASFQLLVQEQGKERPAKIKEAALYRPGSLRSTSTRCDQERQWPHLWKWRTEHFANSSRLRRERNLNRT